MTIDMIVFGLICFAIGAWVGFGLFAVLTIYEIYKAGDDNVPGGKDSDDGM